MSRIDTKDWKIFKLEDLGFTLFHGTRITKLDRVEGNIIFLTAGKENIGVIGTIGNEVDLWNKPITVDMFGNCFYHNCICSGDDNVYAFVNDTISDNCKRFIASCINAKTAHLFSYKEQFRQNNAATLSVYLPTKEDKPNWNYMEDYIKNLEDRVKDTLDKFSQKNTSEKIDTRDWKEFKVGDLFEQDRGKEKSPKQSEDGNCMLISETNTSNGYTKEVKPTKIFKGNCLTVSVNYAETVFYQPDDFCASINIMTLRNEHLNRYNGLFLATRLAINNRKYNYINKISKDLLNNTYLSLPATDDGEPDWVYMENFMKQIELKAAKKLDLLKVNEASFAD